VFQPAPEGKLVAARNMIAMRTLFTEFLPVTRIITKINF
jgi:hypothetical protein